MKAFPNVTPSKHPADLKKVALEIQLRACLTCFNSEAQSWKKMYLTSCYFMPFLNYLYSVTKVALLLSFV